MKLYSKLFSITILAGALRFSSISLIDEVAFLLLLVLLINYRKNSTEVSSRYYLNKYYARATLSFKLLFCYLIFSLIYGTLFDAYFGKIRWLVILTGLLFCDSVFLFYLRKKLNEISRFQYIRIVYNYTSLFVAFYIFYGLFALYVFNINPGFVQSAQTDKWYAIWGTTAYSAIIFLPYLVFNKALRINGYISRWKFLSAYAVTAVGSVLYDSRVMVVVCLAFILVEFTKWRVGSKLVFVSCMALMVTVGGTLLDTDFVKDFTSSGGFLINLVGGSESDLGERDFDRVAHYIATYNVLTNSFHDALFGTGFLNSGKSIITEYFNVYNTYGVQTGEITSGLAGKSVSTFGLSGFLIDNGLIGGLLLIVHLYNLSMVSIKTNLILPYSYIVAMYTILVFILFTIYINDNMLFYLLLSPSITLYPLIKHHSCNIKQ